MKSTILSYSSTHQIALNKRCPQSSQYRNWPAYYYQCGVDVKHFAIMAPIPFHNHMLDRAPFPCKSFLTLWSDKTSDVPQALGLCYHQSPRDAGSHVAQSAVFPWPPVNKNK